MYFRSQGEYDDEPEIEERQEFVTNADGSVTVKTIKTTTQYVEVWRFLQIKQFFL